VPISRPVSPPTEQPTLRRPVGSAPRRAAVDRPARVPPPRCTGESVIGSGQTAGRHGDDTIAISMLWVIRMQDGQIAALQVFQTPA